jgi:hypothetical protein
VALHLWKEERHRRNEAPTRRVPAQPSPALEEMHSYCRRVAVEESREVDNALEEIMLARIGIQLVLKIVLCFPG